MEPQFGAARRGDHPVVSGATSPGLLPVAAVTTVPLLWGNTAAYQWLYFECRAGEYDVIVILSLKDPFVKIDSLSPASVYVTVHRHGSLCCYSYTLLRDLAAVDFLEKVTRWWTQGCVGPLELELPELSLHKSLSISIELLHVPQGFVNGFSNSQRPQGVLHDWQCLAHGVQARVKLGVTGFSGRRGYVSPLCQRASRFFDVPTALKTRFSEDFYFDKIGLCYFDRNAGAEPLVLLPQPWLWWHGAEPFEVGFVFPQLRRGYKVTGQGFWPQLALDSVDYLPDPSLWKTSGFGLRYPDTVPHGSGLLRYSHASESAPFYVRRRVTLKPTQPCPESLEYLDPHILASGWCQKILGFRQLVLAVPFQSYRNQWSP